MRHLGLLLCVLLVVSLGCSRGRRGGTVVPSDAGMRADSGSSAGTDSGPPPSECRAPCARVVMLCVGVTAAPSQAECEAMCAPLSPSERATALACINSATTCEATAACAPMTDTCGTGTDCAACTAMSACGWCAETSRCLTGSSGGPNVGSCTGWSWLSSECPAG